MKITQQTEQGFPKCEEHRNLNKISLSLLATTTTNVPFSPASANNLLEAVRFLELNKG